MPKYQITSPDGKNFEIEAPDGATEDQVLAYAQQQFSAPKTPDGTQFPLKMGKERFADDLREAVQQEGWLGRNLAGAGTAASNISQRAKQLFGNEDKQQIEANKVIASEAPVGAIGGNLGVMYLGAKGLGAMGLPSLGAALMNPKTYAAAATGGATMGALQPSEGEGFLENAWDTAKNSGIGAAGGMAGKFLGDAIGTGARALKSAVEPFYDKGKEAILGRLLKSMAGPEAALVQQRLSDAVEMVPGSQPTVAQVAQNPALAALERTASAVDPSVTNQYGARMAAQNTARAKVLEDLSADTGAKAARSEVAEKLYGEARKGVLNITPEVQEGITKLQSRMPEEVLNQAKKLAKISGEVMDDTTSIQGLHWSKKALDSLISQAKRSGDGDLARAYTGLQNDLLDSMDQLSPAYGAARAKFAEMSRPINQQATAKAISDKAIHPLTGNVQPNALARALSDKTAQSATGFQGSTLENTFDPEQLAKLLAVKGDLANAEFAKTAGRGVGSDTVQKLAYNNMLNQAGVPSAIREFAPTQALGNILGRGADAVYGKANKDMSVMLAEALMDPQKAAQLMTIPAGQSKLADALRRSLTLGGQGLALTEAVQD